MRSRGFTLVELMVSAALVGVVVLYLTRTFTEQHESYQVVDQVTETQQNLRAISALLERDVRLTGYLVPEAAAVCGVDETTDSDTLFVTDSNAAQRNGAASNERGASVTSGYTGTSPDTLTLDDLAIDGQPTYDTDSNGVSDSDFRPNGGVIIVDRKNAERGAACGVVTAVAIAAGTIDVDYAAGAGNLGAAGPGSPTPEIVAIPAHRYQINNTNQLLRDGTVLANDVEDLQIALFYDVDGDGVITSAATEHPGSAGGNVYTPSAWDNRDLREVRVNFVARSRAEDAEFSQGQFQSAENRDPIAGNDGFRRRIFTASVRPRNVGTRVY